MIEDAKLILEDLAKSMDARRYEIKADMKCRKIHGDTLESILIGRDAECAFAAMTLRNAIMQIDCDRANAGRPGESPDVALAS